MGTFTVAFIWPWVFAIWSPVFLIFFKIFEASLDFFVEICQIFYINDMFLLSELNQSEQRIELDMYLRPNIFTDHEVFFIIICTTLYIGKEKGKED